MRYLPRGVQRSLPSLTFLVPSTTSSRAALKALLRLRKVSLRRTSDMLSDGISEQDSALALKQLDNEEVA